MLGLNQSWIKARWNLDFDPHGIKIKSIYAMIYCNLIGYKIEIIFIFQLIENFNFNLFYQYKLDIYYIKY